MVIKWGFQKGKQRYKCKNCGLLFTWANKGVKDKNSWVWFTRWILERRTLKQLSQQSKLPRKALQKLFKKFLSSAPTISIVSKKSAHILIDATYFDGNRCLLIYRDNDLRFTQLFRFSDRERYREIKEDLKNLNKLGVDIESITCDGHRAMLKAIKEVYPKANVQRCYVHVQRMVKAWLTQHPRLPASKQLRFLCGLIHHIKSPIEQQMWTIAINSWYQQNQTIINEGI